LDPKRKCFRLIGGVLVERTVEEVLPAVQKNREGLTQVIGKITEQRDQKMEVSTLNLIYPKLLTPALYIISSTLVAH
jgi:prefoldin subunit 2